MPNTQTYNAKEVHLVHGGALIQGFAEGSFVQIEYNADLFTLQVGADGEAARSKSNNKSARITVTLMPGSIGNTILSASLKASDAGGPPVPTLITDLSTASTHAARESWVVRDPGYDYQTEAQPKTWIIETPWLEGIHGAAI